MLTRTDLPAGGTALEGPVPIDVWQEAFRVDATHLNSPEHLELGLRVLGCIELIPVLPRLGNHAGAAKPTSEI